MQRIGKTQEILKNKVPTQQTENSTDAPCLPCKAKAQAIWKISIPKSYFINPETAEKNFKTVGEILIQYAKFSEAQVQSLFVSIALLDADEHLVYTGNEQTAVDIFNELGKQGIYAKIETAAKKF